MPNTNTFEKNNLFVPKLNLDTEKELEATLNKTNVFLEQLRSQKNLPGPLKFYTERDYTKLAYSNLNELINRNGDTIMHLIAKNLDKPTMELLMLYNPNAITYELINTPNNKGELPIHKAMESAQNTPQIGQDFVNFMVNNLGANTKIPDSNNRIIISREANTDVSINDKLNELHKRAMNDIHTIKQQLLVSGVNKSAAPNNDKELIKNIVDYYSNNSNVQSGGNRYNGRRKIRNKFTEQKVKNNEKFGDSDAEDSFVATNKFIGNYHENKRQSHTQNKGPLEMRMVGGYINSINELKEKENKLKRQEELLRNQRLLTGNEELKFKEMQLKKQRQQILNEYQKLLGRENTLNLHQNKLQLDNLNKLQPEQLNRNRMKMFGGADEINSTDFDTDSDGTISSPRTEDNDLFGSDNNDGENFPSSPNLNNYHGADVTSLLEEEEQNTSSSEQNTSSSEQNTSSSEQNTSPSEQNTSPLRSNERNERNNYNEKNKFDDETDEFDGSPHNNLNKRQFNDYPKSDDDESPSPSPSPSPFLDEQERTRTEADDIYVSFVQKIMDLLGVDEDTARTYRSAIKITLEKNNPELKKRENDALKVKEMQKIMESKEKLQSFLDNEVNMEAVKKYQEERRAEGEKRRQERKNKRRKRQRNRTPKSDSESSAITTSDTTTSVASSDMTSSEKPTKTRKKRSASQSRLNLQNMDVVDGGYLRSDELIFSPNEY